MQVPNRSVKTVLRTKFPLPEHRKTPPAGKQDGVNLNRRELRSETGHRVTQQAGRERLVRSAEEGWKPVPHIAVH